MRVRPVKQVVQSHRQKEGGGFPVRRPFPTRGMDMVDPFLLLDEMGPVEWEPGEALGAPDHPHRGFETVTYVLAGHMQHEDSTGRTGDLGPGDVQWMTAGSGVVHSELPEPGFKRDGGLMHGFQIWVNLPKSHKMMEPRYQELSADELPVAEADGVWVRVIAGSSHGVEAAIDSVTPINYLHFRLQPGAETTQQVPAEHNALLWVFEGAVQVGDEATEVRSGQMATLDAGDAARLAVAEDADGPAQLLLLSGVPLREPVARYGPFVMNYRSEILEAVQDYQAGRMGRIAR